MAAGTERYRTGRVVGLASAAALGGFLFGYDSAVINGAKDAIQSNFDLGNFAIGFVVSIALIGSAVGAWFAGGLAERQACGGGPACHGGGFGRQCRP